MPTETTETLQSLATQIADAVTNGTPLALTPTQIASAGARAIFGTPVTVSFPKDGAALPPFTLLTLPKLAAIVPGFSIVSVIPAASGSLLQNLLSGDSKININVTQVHYLISGNPSRIVTIQIDATFTGQGFDPVTLTTIAGMPLNLTGCSLTVAAPGQNGAMISLQFTGEVPLTDSSPSSIIVPTVADTLSFSISMPDMNLSVSMVDSYNPPSLDAILALTGIKTTLFGGMALTGFDMTADLLPPIGPPTFALNFEIANTTPNPVLDQITAVFQYGSGTIANVSAVITPLKGGAVTFNVQAGYDSGTHIWTFAGLLDTAATLLALGKEPTDPLLLSDVVAKIPLVLPSFFPKTLEIKILSLQAAYSDADSKFERIAADVTLEVSWSMGGEQILLATTFDLTLYGSGTNTVIGVFSLDGLTVTATFNWQSVSGKEDPTVDVALAGWDGWGFDGQLDMKTGATALTVTPPAGYTFAELLAQFIAEITGNPYTSLSEPWDTLLNEQLPRSLAFNLDFKKKTYGVEVPVNISLLGFTVNKFSLKYQSGRGFSLSVSFAGTPPPGLQQTTSWDPTKPSSAPVIPGKGPAGLEIILAGVGQNLHLDSAPVNAPSALNALSDLLTAADSGKLPTFASDNGWMLGLHLMVLGQAELQLAFCDPTLYALQLTVNSKVVPSGTQGSKYLAALVGLSVEVLYRKVSSTLGVFEASLTLPKSIQTLEVGLFELHLPTLSAEVYTDGEFSFDVGFPYNGDFSQSATIVAGEYNGAGGMYLARLSNWNAPALPKVGSGVLGSFGTVTEIGLGLQVGIGYQYSSGPLSASVMASVSGIFEGVFSPFTNYTTNTVTEYYSVTASVSLSGRVQGSVNFAIISASVMVAFSANVLLTAVAGAPVGVSANVSLSAQAQLTVNLGLFKVHYSFSFSTSLSFSTQLGSSSPQPWTGARSTELEAGSHSWTLEGHFRPFPSYRVFFKAFFFPVLSRTSDTGTAEWCYLPQLQVSTETDANFNGFMKAVMGWFLYAYSSAHKSTVPANQGPDAMPISRAILNDLQTYLTSAKATTCIREADMEAFFRANLLVELSALTQDTITLYPFPMLPNLQCAVTMGVSLNALQAHEKAQAKVLADYLLLIASSLTGEILYMMPNLEATTLGEIWNQLSADTLSNATGALTRFMLHGTLTGDPPVSLYQATGQVFPMLGSALQAAGSITVAVSTTNAMAYSVQFPGGISPLSLSSGQGTVFSPQQIAAFPSEPPIAAIQVTVTDAPQTLKGAYPLIPGTNVSNGGCIQTLNAPLQALMATNRHSLTEIALTCQGKPIATGAAWAMAFSLQIQIDPQNAGAPVYTVGKLQGGTLANLIGAYNQIVSKQLSLGAVELLVSSGSGGATSIIVDDQNVYVYQQNLSNVPLPAVRAVREAEIPGFYSLGLLVASALTNNGGYALSVAPSAGVLPAGCFDENGLATVTVAVSFAAMQANADLGCLNTVRFSVASGITAAQTVLASGASLPNPQLPTFGFGEIGVQTNLTPETGYDTDYSSSLSSLFSLVGITPSVTGGGKTVTGPMMVASTQTPQSQTPYVFLQSFNLLALAGNHTLTLYADPSLAKHRPLPLNLRTHDPYQYVGRELNIAVSLVDVYGDVLRKEAYDPTSVTLPWIDVPAAPNAWPGVTISYEIDRVAVVNTPLLRLHMHWKAGRGLTEAQRISTMMLFGRIYHQLGHGEASVDFSLLPAAPLTEAGEILKRPLAVTLQSHVALILDALYAGLNECPLPEITLLMPRDARDYTALSLTQLAASVRITLNGGGGSATSSLQEYLHRGDGAASLRQFATQFETALSLLGAKLMVGSTGADGESSLWMMNTSASGVSIKVTPAASNSGYAPLPLSLQLQTRADCGTDLNHFILNGGGKQFDLISPVPCTGMDVDGTMASFLQTLDMLLTPASAVLAEQVLQGQVLQQMVMAKQTLADVLSGYAVPLTDTDVQATAITTAARECYRQNILAAASSYYSVDALAMYTVEITNSPQTRVNVFGHLKASSQSEVSLSPLTCQWQGQTSYAPVAISVREKGSVDEVKLPTSLQIDALEFNLQTVQVQMQDGSTGSYTYGTWLHYALPPEPLSLAAEIVALPLRSYPQSVALQSQQAAPQQAAAEQTLLSHMLSWDLACNFQSNYVAQDSLLVTVQMNTLGFSAKMLGDATTDLVDALGQYQMLMAKIGPTLAALPTHYGQQSLPQNMQDALAAFGGAAQLVAAQAGNRPTTARGFSDGTSQFTFEVLDGPADLSRPLDSPWIVRVLPPVGNNPLPDVASLVPGLDGYQATRVQYADGSMVYTFHDNDGHVLTGRHAETLTARSLTVKDFFDILGVQSAQMSIAVERNKYISPAPAELRGQMFPQGFRYIAPSVAFPLAAQPAFQLSDQVDLTTIPPAAAQPTLVGVVTNLLVNAVSSAIVPTGTAVVELHLSLNLPLTTASGKGSTVLPPVNFPIGIVSAGDIPLNSPPAPNASTAIAKLAGAVAASVQAWAGGPLQTGQAPWTTANLQITLSMFNTAGPSASANFIVDGLYVPTNKLSGWS